jgi:hypothetical protein
VKICLSQMLQAIGPSKGGRKIGKGASITVPWKTPRMWSSKNSAGWRRISESNVIRSLRILKARTLVYWRGIDVLIGGDRRRESR